MRQDMSVNNPVLKILLVMLAFIGVLGAGVWSAHRWLTPAGRSSAPVRAGGEAENAAAADDDSFFYGSIGAVPTTTGPSDAGDPPQANYTLEVKTVGSSREAEAVVREMAAKGVEMFYTPLTRGGQVVYRVRRGVFASERAAQHASAALKKNHGVKAAIVRL